MQPDRARKRQKGEQDGKITRQNGEKEQKKKSSGSYVLGERRKSGIGTGDYRGTKPRKETAKTRPRNSIEGRIEKTPSLRGVILQKWNSKKGSNGRGSKTWKEQKGCLRRKV